MQCCRRSIQLARVPISAPVQPIRRALRTTIRNMATSQVKPPANPRPVVLSGPSGAGKSTLLKRLFAAHPNIFGLSVSHTTRNPRSGEQHGREYHFVTRDAFLQLVDEKGFIEHATFSGNMYGSSVKAVKDVQAEGVVCVLDIEMEGAKQVAKTDLNARFVFIAPPDMKTLETRLRARGTETEDGITKRLEAAEREMAWAEQTSPRPHEKIIVNQDLDRAYQELEEWVLDQGKFGS